ncbi:acetyl-CoA carboxylase biotin carboxyl carrier protein, partial [Francisella tularensis subsp. holarctica]|nr:acetyl-CoA carboxylase biotin carboxyl carrier protein [Francisella tularensis subsp. holarctica]
LNSSDIKEIRIKDGGSSIFMTKNNTDAITSVVSAAPVASNVASAAPEVATAATSAAAPNVNLAEEISGEEFKSPMVG